jgi:hypothetical protein
MAAIAFNAEQRTAERLETVLIAVGERIDPPISYQMSLATADTEPACATPDEHAGSTTPFRPLDASIVSDAIPAFFIGRNRDGFWVARDAKGRNGGIFLLKASAVSFARALSGGRTGCATIFPTESFELDLKNSGNPLIPFLRPLTRLALHLQQWALAGAGQIAAAILRRRKT